MSKLYPKFFLLLCSLFAGGFLLAQSCTYTLEMFDSFGDGWTGGTLTISLDTVDTEYTLEDGSEQVIFFSVTDGQTMVLSYVQGSFPGDVSFNIIDANCNELYGFGPGGTQGDSIFVDTLSCPACVAPNLCQDITASRLRYNSVDIGYSPVDLDTAGNDPVYLIEFDTTGFTPGTGNFRTTSDTIFRVQPLIEFTGYDIYVSTICYEGQDTSNRVGPLNIFTPYRTDLGITVLTDPVSGCELGAEEVRFGITNFGGEAKSFIRTRIAVNEVELGIDFPNDGLYTGVVGVDSTEFTSFDQTPNFGAPGEYKIEIWTDFAADRDSTNDTLTTYLYSAPTEGVFPYFIDFEEEDGFWMDQERNSNLSSWQYGMPNATFIAEAAGGENAWVSNLDGFTNAGELSYLYSPCFDLSADDTDPVISFDFINALVGFGTNVTLEVATDGINFEKVGAFGEGLNWYNNSFNNYWSNEFGVVPEWRFTAIKVAGLAGEPSVRFRFRLDVNDFSTNNEGVGVDNFYLSPQTEAELAALNVSGPGDLPCGSPQDFPTMTFTNLASEEATEVMLSYQVNGGDIVTESFPDTLAPFEEGMYTFLTPYDGSLADENVIVAWVSLAGDDFTLNDTVTSTIRVREEVPFYEDFEEGLTAVEDWSLSDIVILDNDHNSGSNVLFANLFNGNNQFFANSPNYGTLAVGDSLLFDYRFVEFPTNGNTPTFLNDGDSLTIDLIVDCDSIISGFVRITADDHNPSTAFTRIAVELPAGVAGSSVQLVFNGFADADAAAGSDFYLDIDNINLKRCAPSLDVVASIFNPADTTELGQINLFPNDGLAPYTYEWSNGATTAALDSLETGIYSVTITDVQGCTEFYEYSIIISSTEEQVAEAFTDLKVFPNPTTGLLQLQLDLPVGTPLQYALFNQMGQRIMSRQLSSQSQLNETIDLSQQPAGIYFLRLSGAGSQRTVRVVKTR